MPLLRTGLGPASKKEKEAGGNKYARKQRQAREFDAQGLVYQKRLDKLVKENKKHSDIDILKAIVDTLHALIPVAEEAYNTHPLHTNAAAINNLMSQMREAINDIRGLEDFSHRGEKITEYVAQQYRGVFQALISDLLTLQKTLHLDAKGQATLKEFQKDQATRFNEAKHAVDTHVLKLLQMK